MSKELEILKQARDWIDGNGRYDKAKQLVKDIDELLAQPEQEPVARMLVKDGIGWIEWKNPIRLSDGLHDLHTTTQQRTWVGLSQEDFIYFCSYVRSDVLSEIEAKLKELNA